MNPAYFDEKFTLFETHRALLNSYFCNNVEGIELQDEARFAKRHREHEKRMLDEVQVYQDVKAVEESRRMEGPGIATATECIRSAATGFTTMLTRLEAIVSESICGSRGPESWSVWDDENYAECTLRKPEGHRSVFLDLNRKCIYIYE